MKLSKKIILAAGIFISSIVSAQNTNQKKPDNPLFHGVKNLEMVAQDLYSSSSINTNLEKPALLIVDMQSFFLEVVNQTELRREIPHYVALIDEAYKNDVPVFLIEYKDCGKTHRKIRKALAKGHYETLVRDTSEIVVIDKIEFRFSDDAFYKTNLGQSLRKEGVDRVVTAGVNIGACIARTWCGALNEEFLTAITFDAAADPNKKIRKDKRIELYYDTGKVFNNYHQVIDYFRFYGRNRF
ncbi:MAG: isochorismatase family protein [Candidatus Nanoarchaeia archaeon]